jgi:transcriptional regulator with XRE-family HTH domain
MAERLRALRGEREWSLSDLERQTGGKLAKSRLSNYEQGTRTLGVEEAELLATIYGVPAAFLLCVDDDMTANNKVERDLLRDFRALPENERVAYAQRISALASAYRHPVPDERVAQHIPPAPPKNPVRS